MKLIQDYESWSLLSFLWRNVAGYGQLLVKFLAWQEVPRNQPWLRIDWWSPEDRQAVFILTQRTYWSRMWMVLELATAREDPLVGCGQRWVSLSAFRHLKLELECTSHPIVYESPSWTKQIRIRDEYLSASRLNLLTALRATSNFRVTDQRDRIHALLGLVDEKHQTRLQCISEKSYGALSVELVVHLIKEEGDLGILSRSRLGAARHNIDCQGAISSKRS
jgi:hypothetical protein